MPKELLKQVGISICFIALFTGLQIGTQFVFGYGYVFYGQVAGWQMSAEELSIAANEFLVANTELYTLISGFATILMVWLFSIVRKKKFIQDLNLVPFDVRNLFPIVLMVIGCYFVISGVFFFLSEDLMNSYNENMGPGMEGIVVTFLSSAVLAPVAEELVFRGIIMSRLNRAMNIVLAVIFTSLSFGIFHGQIIQATYAVVLGLIMGFISVRCNSLLASCFFHILFNTIGSFFFIEAFLGSSLMANIIVSIIGLVIIIATIIWIYKINEGKSNIYT